MRNVVWICAAVAFALTIADARAEGEGLATDADRVPWARVQSRIAAAPGAPGWRADLAPLERSGLQVGGVGFLGDVYFGSTQAERASAGGFRATSGVLVGARSPLLAAVSSSSTGGLFASDRRLFGASANPIVAPADPSLESTTRSLRRHRLQQPGGQERLALQRRPRRRFAESRQRGPLRPRLRRRAEPRRRDPRHAAGAGRPARRLVFLLIRSPGVCR